MNAKKLGWIKSMQRKYYRLFGERLFIDFNTMNGVEGFPVEKVKKLVRQNNNEDYINGVVSELCLKHGIQLKQIRENRSRKKPAERSEWMDRHRAFMIDLSRAVIENKLNQAITAKIINKDRTMFYHYYSEKPIINEQEISEISD